MLTAKRWRCGMPERPPQSLFLWSLNQSEANLKINSEIKTFSLDSSMVRDAPHTNSLSQWEFPHFRSVVWWQTLGKRRMGTSRAESMVSALQSSHVFDSRLFEAATHSDAAGGAFRVPRTAHGLVWSEKTAPQKTVPGWPRAHRHFPATKAFCWPPAFSLSAGAT